MHEHYEYRRIRVAPRSWARVIEQVRGAAQDAVRDAGGTLYGLFIGQIGLGANEAALISAWPDEAAARGSGAVALTGVDDVLESTSEPLVATVRPRDPSPPQKPGVYAHRWFQIQEKDWPEFVALSEGAWPSFESAYDVKVQGFWRSLAVEPPDARVLLLTYYPTLAHWENSRGPRTPQPNTPAESHQRFARRHQLTQDTIVSTTRLARLS